MYTCYIDESGHCGQRFDPNQPIEVICGVLTDVTKLFKTKREYRQLLSILEKNKISVREIKAIEVYRGKKNWHGVDPAIRQTVIKFLLDWAEGRNCKYVICPIDSRKFFSMKNEGSEIAHKLNYPYEAGGLNVLLAIQRCKSGSKKNKGKTWVIFDEQNCHDKGMIRLIDSDLSFTDGYTGYSKHSSKGSNEERLNEIVDIPFFSKSHRSIVIQLADLVAFITNRYILLTVYKSPESYDGEIEVITKWYSQIRNNLISYTDINPTAKDDLSQFYRDVRPDGWNVKKWFVQ